MKPLLDEKNSLDNLNSNYELNFNEAVLCEQDCDQSSLNETKIFRAYGSDGSTFQEALDRSLQTFVSRFIRIFENQNQYNSIKKEILKQKSLNLNSNYKLDLHEEILNNLDCFPPSFDETKNSCYLNSNYKLDICDAVLCEQDCDESSLNETKVHSFEDSYKKRYASSPYLNSNYKLDMREEVLCEQDCDESSLNEAKVHSFDDSYKRQKAEIEILITQYPNGLDLIEFTMNLYGHNLSRQHKPLNDFNKSKTYESRVLSTFTVLYLPKLLEDYIEKEKHESKVSSSYSLLYRPLYGSNENLFDYLSTRFDFASSIGKGANGISKMSDFILNGQNSNQLIETDLAISWTKLLFMRAMWINFVSSSKTLFTLSASILRLTTLHL